MYKKLAAIAVVSLLALNACGGDDSSPSIDTNREKTSETVKTSDAASRDKGRTVVESESLSFDCRMKNDDSATVTKKLAVDYDSYGKLAAYTETAEYDESVSWDELDKACQEAKKENVEVVCEDNVIVTMYVVENVEREDIGKVLKERCREKSAEE